MDIRDVYPLIIDDPMLADSSVFTSNNSGILVHFLMTIGYKTSGDEFWRSGFWIPVDIQIELQEGLLRRITELQLLHTPEFRTFEAMYDNFSILPQAQDVYLEEYFPQDQLIDYAVRELLSEHPETDGGFAASLMKVLAEELLRRGIVAYRHLFSSLLEELRNYLADIGRIPNPEPESEYREGAQSEDAPDRTLGGALRSLGFAAEGYPDKQELKRRYKDLMKKWHPDINPRGLEKSKEINEAYARLLKKLDSSDRT